MKKDPPIWITAGFECGKIPEEDPQKNIVYKQTSSSRLSHSKKNPYYENLKIEKKWEKYKLWRRLC